MVEDEEAKILTSTWQLAKNISHHSTDPHSICHTLALPSNKSTGLFAGMYTLRKDEQDCSKIEVSWAHEHAHFCCNKWRKLSLSHNNQEIEKKEALLSFINSLPAFFHPCAESSFRRRGLPRLRPMEHIFLGEKQGWNKCPFFFLR